DAAEALEMLRCHDISAVVTDHLLGRSTAAELALAMRRLKPHVPIIPVAGTTDTEEALGYADRFVRKGEGPEAVIAALDQILMRKIPEAGADSAAQSLMAGLPMQELLAAIVSDSSDAILSKT